MSNPSQSNPSDDPADAGVGPSNRTTLVPTKAQVTDLAKRFPFPGWLVDLAYDVDYPNEPMVEGPALKKDMRGVPGVPRDTDVPSAAQEQSPKVTDFRAIMLSAIYSPAGDPSEQWDRADIAALETLARNEAARANLWYGQMHVDRAKAYIKAAQDALDDATRRGDPVYVERGKKVLDRAKESLTKAEMKRTEPEDVWDALVQKYNEDTPQGGRPIDPVIAAHEKVQMEAKKLVSAAKNPVTKWLKQVFDGIKVQQLIPPKPANFPVDGPYVDNTLYIITMPEFAFNGRITPDDESVWNAAYPFHEDLETFIYEQVRSTLRETYPHVRVIFAFSCCTYSSDLLFQVDLDGLEKLSAKPKRKLASANRITIVTSAGPKRPRRITKFEPSNVDGWTKEKTIQDDDESSGQEGSQDEEQSPWVLDHNGAPELLFTKANLLHHTGERSVARFSEIMYDVKYHFGGEGENAVLAFGTCLDVVIDDHHRRDGPLVNMCIYLGAGLPLSDIRDNSHPFILNDVYSKNWTGSNEAKLAPGWYQFSPNMIGGQQSVAELWQALGSEVDKDSVAWKLYWDRGVTTPGSPVVTRDGSRISYTKKIPLPAPPANLQ